MKTDVDKKGKRGRRDSSSSSSSSSDSDGSKSDRSTPPQSARPKAAHPSSRRSQSPQKDAEYESISPLPSQNAGDSELHILRRRKARSAPTRPQSMMSQSANLIYLQKELTRIQRQMEQARRINMARRPVAQPYTPYTWNSLSPYYNTDTVRHLLQMPVPVRQGYSTRMTAIGMVDPEVSWRMDHVLMPYTPSRPEMYRKHMKKRRSKSAATDYGRNEILTPQYPKLKLPRDDEDGIPRYSARSSKLPTVSQRGHMYNAYYASPKPPNRASHKVK